MRIGIASPQAGRMADPAAVLVAARAADQVGYATLWVLDRLPVSAAPPTGGPTAPPAGVLPDGTDGALDPFVVLAAAAAVTERVRIGTSVLVAPWYPPVVLARLLTSLDVMSEGRLTVGLGTGWSPDEPGPSGVAPRQRGRRLEDVLDVLDAQWGDGPCAVQGTRAGQAGSERLLRSGHPRPPVLLAGSTPAALERVARRADGWMPAGLAPDALAPRWAEVRARAAAYGRDPEALHLVVRANVHLLARPEEGARAAFQGDLEQVVGDVEACRRVGATEVVLDLGGLVGLDEALDGYARIAEAIGGPSRTTAA